MHEAPVRRGHEGDRLDGGIFSGAEGIARQRRIAEPLPPKIGVRCVPGITPLLTEARALMRKPVSRFDFLKLVGILGRLGSDFAGGRDVAPIIATRFVRSRNMGLDEVFLPALEPSHRASSPLFEDWLATVENRLIHPARISVWDIEHVISLRKFPCLSEKQADRLAIIGEKAGAGRRA
jgi:hypothetical protein